MARYLISTHNKGKKTVVGAYDDDTKVFTKTVDSKIHTCWKHKAYGMSTDIAQMLATKGCEGVRITEKDTGDVYLSPFSLWQKEGLYDTLNANAGEQLFLAKDLMTKHIDHEQVDNATVEKDSGSTS